MEVNQFKFEKDEIENHIKYELKLFRKMSKSFNYVYDKLVEHGFSIDITNARIDLSNVKSSDDKSYSWIAVTSGNVKLLIRSYGLHHTIYTKNVKNEKDEDSDMVFTDCRYGAFTFHTDTNRLSGDKSDFYCDNHFHDLNEAMLQILEHVSENNVWSLWNDYGFKRPEYVNVKVAYSDNSIQSVDNLIFCAEELSTKHMALFAEIDMLEILKGLGDVTGEPFENGIVAKVCTEFPKEYREPYYHGVGLSIIDKEDKKDFKDVYCLSRWYLEDVLKLIKK